MKSAKVEDGVVTNAIVGSLPGYLPCDDLVQIGWLYDGEYFHPPDAHPSDEVLPNLYPDQFWFGLRAGGYDDDVLAWVASLNDPGTEAEPNPNYDPMAWAYISSKLEFAKVLERDDPLIEELRVAVGMPVHEMDALWKFAAS